MSFDCEVTQQTFRQMGLDFAKIFGQQLTKQPAKQAQQSIFDDEEEEQEIDPNVFADESDDPYWYDDDGSIYSQD